MLETEIRPAELMGEQARLHARDVAWLDTRRHRFVNVDCPACGQPDGEPLWAKDGFTYLQCGCGTVYASPRPTPDLLDEFYQRSENYRYWNGTIFPASEEARRDRIFKPRATRIAAIVWRHCPSARTLVDVGAGFGTFCQEAERLHLFDRVIALEPEPHLAATCQRKGLDVVNSTVEKAHLPDVDVVTAFEVIEHLFSPREFVGRCARILGRGGLLVLTAPNVQGFDIEMLAERSATVDVEHLNYMHPGSLTNLLEREGFEVLESETPGRLDADLVRQAALAGEVDLDPFLARVLLDDWDSCGAPFQDFLVAAGRSSNMWLVAKRC